MEVQGSERKVHSCTAESPGSLLHELPSGLGADLPLPGVWLLPCVYVGARMSAYACLCIVNVRRHGGRASSHPLCGRFFEALEQRHKAQVCVDDISDILEEHAERHFHPYVVYCSNEVYQQRTLQKLT